MGSLGTCVLPLGFKARWGHHLFLGWDPPSKLAVELVWGGAAGQGCCREHPRGTFWCEDIPSAKGKDLGPCKDRHSRAWGQARRDVQELMGRQGEMFKGLGADQGETFEGFGARQGEMFKGFGARQGEMFKGFGARQGEMFKGLEPGKERHSRAWGQARRDIRGLGARQGETFEGLGPGKERSSLYGPSLPGEFQVEILVLPPLTVGVLCSSGNIWVF